MGSYIECQVRGTDIPWENQSMKVIHLSLITLMLSTFTLSGTVAFILFQDLSQTLEGKGQKNSNLQVVRVAN